MRRRALSLAAALAAAAPAACGGGTPSPDLFVVQRSGSVPGARLTLLVSDTTVRCNGRDARSLSSDQILEAREIQDRLLELLDDEDRPPLRASRAPSIFRFEVRTEDGVVRFTDRTLRPTVLARVAVFTRTAAQDLCGLPR